MKTLLISFLILGGLNSFGQEGNSDSLIVEQVFGSQTDSNISGEIFRSYTFYNPDAAVLNKLLLYLPGSGDQPSTTQLFPSLAANNGYHVINLKYENGQSAHNACGGSTDPDCHLNFRKEIIEGIDYSTIADVDQYHSINNRFLKLLEYMHDQNPTQAWNQYYSGGAILWNKITVAGHSQGGGHAAVIGITENLERVLMFASPNDYFTSNGDIASWTSLAHVTPSEKYFGFICTNDNVVDADIQFNSFDSLGLNLVTDSISVDLNNCPFNNSQNLYTDLDLSGATVNHSLMIRDGQTPLDGNGKPIFESAWRYMLNLGCSTTNIPQNEVLEDILFPNPAAEMITFKSDRVEDYEILNLAGKRVQTGKLSIGLNQIDLQILSSGMYVFLTSSKDGIKITIE